MKNLVLAAVSFLIFGSFAMGEPAGPKESVACVSGYNYLGSYFIEFNTTKVASEKVDVKFGRDPGPDDTRFAYSAHDENGSLVTTADGDRIVTFAAGRVHLRATAGKAKLSNEDGAPEDLTCIVTDLAKP